VGTTLPVNSYYPSTSVEQTYDVRTQVVEQLLVEQQEIVGCVRSCEVWVKERSDLSGRGVGLLVWKECGLAVGAAWVMVDS
jgi:hypothetical protein